jgi:hypothetical protein
MLVACEMNAVWRATEFGKEHGFSGRLFSRRRQVCHAQLIVRGDRLLLMSIEVPSPLRGNGYGKAMMRGIDTEFAHRFTQVLLAVRPFSHSPFDEKQLVQFYTSLGYQRQGQTPQGYPVMRKVLLDA